MDHLGEAKKFIQRAQSASHKEVIDQHLVLADWYLSEAIKERDGASDAQNADQPDSGPKTASARLG
jgi:hypothetical protein